jgi:hypothetical protein
MVMPECERVGFLAMPKCPRCEHELTRPEIGILYSAVVRTRGGNLPNYGTAKLTKKAVRSIRRSKEPIDKLAEKHNVSFSTIWRAKTNITHKHQHKMNCPYCGQKLTPRAISKLFASLGGSTSKRQPSTNKKK